MDMDVDMCKMIRQVKLWTINNWRWHQKFCQKKVTVRHIIIQMKLKIKQNNPTKNRLKRQLNVRISTRTTSIRTPNGMWFDQLRAFISYRCWVASKTALIFYNVLTEHVDWYAFIDIGYCAGTISTRHGLPYQSRTTNHSQVQWTHRKYFKIDRNFVFNFFFSLSLHHFPFVSFSFVFVFALLRFSSVSFWFFFWFFNYNHQKRSINYYRKLHRNERYLPRDSFPLFPFCFSSLSFSPNFWFHFIDGVFVSIVISFCFAAKFSHWIYNAAIIVINLAYGLHHFGCWQYE